MSEMPLQDVDDKQVLYININQENKTGVRTYMNLTNLPAEMCSDDLFSQESCEGLQLLGINILVFWNILHVRHIFHLHTVISI